MQHPVQPTCNPVQPHSVPACHPSRVKGVARTHAARTYTYTVLDEANIQRTVCLHLTARPAHGLVWFHPANGAVNKLSMALNGLKDNDDPEIS